MSCTCQYCKQPAKLVTGEVIYPHRPDLASLNFWLCAPCGAYVGCHKKGAKSGRTVSDGTLPLGRLANAELRRLKSLAHGVFDPLWKDGGMHRKAAYSWLASKMGLQPGDCHIGDFSVEQCQQVIRICQPAQDKKLQTQAEQLEKQWAARWGNGI